MAGAVASAPRPDLGPRDRGMGQHVRTPMTLYVHERHRVDGRHEDEFEAAFRDPGGWMDALGRTDEARLLWYLNQAHGSGPSYVVVTITAVADGAAWERLARRLHDGDLRDWVRHVDTLRHDVTAKVMLPVDWSPLADLDPAAVASDPAGHEPTLYMEDTVWPRLGRLDDYLAAAGEHYAPLIGRPESLLELAAALVPAIGAGDRPEVVLVQKLRDADRLVPLLASEIPAERRAPGTWMHDALEWREDWQSRLLRTAPWSPWS
jgi:hypothetical protein